jgi:hypothetical protein
MRIAVTARASHVFTSLSLGMGKSAFTTNPGHSLCKDNLGNNGAGHGQCACKSVLNASLTRGDLLERARARSGDQVDAWSQAPLYRGCVRGNLAGRAAGETCRVVGWPTPRLFVHIR